MQSVPIAPNAHSDPRRHPDHRLDLTDIRVSKIIDNPASLVTQAKTPDTEWPSKRPGSLPCRQVDAVGIENGHPIPHEKVSSSSSNSKEKAATRQRRRRRRHKNASKSEARTMQDPPHSRNSNCGQSQQRPHCHSLLERSHRSFADRRLDEFIRSKYSLGGSTLAWGLQPLAASPTTSHPSSKRNQPVHRSMRNQRARDTVRSATSTSSRELKGDICRDESPHRHSSPSRINYGGSHHSKRSKGAVSKSPTMTQNAPQHGSKRDRLRKTVSAPTLEEEDPHPICGAASSQSTRTKEANAAQSSRPKKTANHSSKRHLGIISKDKRDQLEKACSEPTLLVSVNCRDSIKHKSDHLGRPAKPGNGRPSSPRAKNKPKRPSWAPKPLLRGIEMSDSEDSGYESR